MKNTVGSPVYGEDFRFRNKNLRKALRLLANKNSFLILGIRRMGKSSFLKQVAFLLKKEDKNAICIELDCSLYKNNLDFYQALYKSLPKNLQTKFKKMLSDGSQLPKKLADAITDTLNSIEFLKAKVEFKDKLLTYNNPLEEIVSEFFKGNDNVYLFLDELPFFFENMEAGENGILEITNILSNFKSWRNNGLPMAITGSLNLHQQLEHLGISRKLLGGLNSIELEPFSKEESIALIKELIKIDNLNWWTDEVTEELLKLLPDYLPYFLQFAYNEIAINECKNANEVKDVFYNDIMNGLLKDFIYQFEERLKVFSDLNLKTAMLILDEIAKFQPLNLQHLTEKLNDKFSYEVLVKLIDHEFLKLSGQQEYRFALNIIQNWWVNKRKLIVL